MNFSTLSPTLADTAAKALTFCKSQYGQKGLTIEQGIHNSISWRPTFFLKRKNFEMIAVEVSDVLFPDVLKGAAQEIRHYDQMIRVFQVAPLDVYLADRDQRRVSALRSQGFGLITVSSEGIVTRQHDCVPLMQFISEAEMEEGIRTLPQALRVRFRTAYQTYLTNPIQGVQDAGQITEGLIQSVANQSAARAGLSNSALRTPLAGLIDLMYINNFFTDIRAALGAARGFVNLYRNPTSHSPRSAKEAVSRIKHAREGFITSVRTAVMIAEAIKKLNLKVIVHD